MFVIRNLNFSNGGGQSIQGEQRQQQNNNSGMEEEDDARSVQQIISLYNANVSIPQYLDLEWRKMCGCG